MTTKNSYNEIESRKRIIYLIDTFCGGRQQVFASKCGIGKSSVSQYVNGTNTPGNIHASKIADTFGVNIMWVMGFNVPMKVAPHDKADKVSYIPIYGKVSAGRGVVAYDEIEDYLMIDKDRDANEYFAVRIRGNSMMPRFCEDDLVIAHRQDYAVDDDIVIAVCEDNVLCKRFKKFSGGIMLVSNNSEYEPLVFPCISEEEPPVHIIGKVVELRGKV